jgi:hypothetical protein
MERMERTESRSEPGSLPKSNSHNTGGNFQRILLVFMKNGRVAPTRAWIFLKSSPQPTSYQLGGVSERQHVEGGRRGRKGRKGRRTWKEKP